MKSLSPFDDAGRWITTGTTDVNNGYPYLLWQENEIFDASGFVWFIVEPVTIIEEEEIEVTR